MRPSAAINNSGLAERRSHYMRHDTDRLRTSPYRMATSTAGNSRSNSVSSAQPRAGGVAYAHQQQQHAAANQQQQQQQPNPAAYRDPANTFYSNVDANHEGYGDDASYVLPGGRMAQRVQVRQSRSQSRGRSGEYDVPSRPAALSYNQQQHGGHSMMGGGVGPSIGLTNLPPPPLPQQQMGNGSGVGSYNRTTSSSAGIGMRYAIPTQSSSQHHHNHGPRDDAPKPRWNPSNNPTASVTTTGGSGFPSNAINHPVVVAQLQQWAASYAQQVLDTQTKELREALRQAYDRIDALTAQNQKLVAQQQSRATNALMNGGIMSGSDGLSSAAGSSNPNGSSSYFSFDILSMNGVECAITTTRLKTRQRRTTTVMSEDVRPNSTVTLVFPDGSMSVQLEVVNPMDGYNDQDASGGGMGGADSEPKIISMAEDVCKVVLLADEGSPYSNGGGAAAAAGASSTSLISSYHAAQQHAAIATLNSSCAVEITFYDKEISRNGMTGDNEAVQVRLVLRGPSDSATEALYRAVSALLAGSKHRRGTGTYTNQQQQHQQQANTSSSSRYYSATNNGASSPDAYSKHLNTSAAAASSYRASVPPTHAANATPNSAMLQQQQQYRSGSTASTTLGGGGGASYDVGVRLPRNVEGLLDHQPNGGAGGAALRPTTPTFGAKASTGNAAAAGTTIANITRVTHVAPTGNNATPSVDPDDEYEMLRAVEALTKGVAGGVGGVGGNGRNQHNQYEQRRVVADEESYRAGSAGSSNVSPLRRQLSPMSQAEDDYGVDSPQYGNNTNGNPNNGRNGAASGPRYTSLSNQLQYEGHGVPRHHAASLVFASVSPSRSPSQHALGGGGAPLVPPYNPNSFDRARSAEDEAFINNAWERVFGKGGGGGNASSVAGGLNLTSGIANANANNMRFGNPILHEGIGGHFANKSFNDVMGGVGGPKVMSAVDAAYALRMGGGNGGGGIVYDGGGRVSERDVLVGAAAGNSRPLPQLPPDADSDTSAGYGAPPQPTPRGGMGVRGGGGVGVGGSASALKSDFASPGGHDDYGLSATLSPTQAGGGGGAPPPPPAKAPPTPPKAAPPPPKTVAPPPPAAAAPSPPASGGAPPPPPPPPPKKAPPPPPPAKKAAPPPPPAAAPSASPVANDIPPPPTPTGVPPPPPPPAGKAPPPPPPPPGKKAPPPPPPKKAPPMP